MKMRKSSKKSPKSSKFAQIPPISAPNSQNSVQKSPKTIPAPTSKSPKTTPKSPKSPKSRKSHPLALLIPLLAGAIFLLLATLNLQLPIWFDESYSAYLTRGSFADIWRLTALDVHPPLYYFLLKIWGALFGGTDFALRFMSVFFGVIAIIFTFQLFKKLFGLRAAGFATLAMAFSPILLRYGQEMRMYTLVLAIVIIATYVLVIAIEKQKWRYWLLYGFFVSLGMWTHYFTALAWLAHLGFIIYYYHKHNSGGQVPAIPSSSPARPVAPSASLASSTASAKPATSPKSTTPALLARYQRPLLAYLLAVALFLPWLPSAVHQVLDVEGGFWIGAVSLVTPLDFLSNALVYASAADAVNWLSVLVLGVVIFTTFFTIKFYRQAIKTAQSDSATAESAPLSQPPAQPGQPASPSPPSLRLLLTLILAPPLILLVLSLPPLRSLFVDRYVAYSAVLIWCLIGLLLSWLFSKNFPGVFPTSSLKSPASSPHQTSASDSHKTATSTQNIAPKTLALKILRPLFALLILITAAVGVVRVETRPPDGSVKDIVEIATTLATDGQPILARGTSIYYDAILYSTDQHPIYGVDPWYTYQWGSLEPIRQLGYNLITDLDAFTAAHPTLWLLVDNDEKSADLPPGLADYRVVTDVATEKHRALELTRES